MLTDDLTGRVALDSLCAGIPTGHESIGIEHENGIFAHALDQKTKPLLAASQVLLVTSPLGQITRDFAEADELSLGCSHGCDDHVRPKQRAILSDSPTLVLKNADL